MRPVSIRKNLKNAANKGVAMISVMITLTVCLLIATIVLQITYTSLLSRKVNTQASNNFYSAESAIDDVQTVLQSLAVYSASQMSSGDEFVDTVVSALLTASGATSIADTSLISQYLYNNLDDDLKIIFGKEITDASGNKVYVYDPLKFSVSAVTKHEAGVTSDKGRLTFSVLLAYEDEKGYFTQISTDLIINDVVTRKSASSYALGSYSMFTGGGVEFYGNDASSNQRGVFIQEGNCYVGTMGDEAPKAMGIDQSIVYLTGATIINGDVYIKNNGALSFTAGSDGTNRTEITIRGTVYIDSSSALIISEDVDFLCEDIVIVDGSNKYSVFTDNKPYISYSNAESYNKLFPCTGATIEAVKANTTICDDFYSKATGGCVLISSDDYAYVAETDGTDWYLNKGGTKVKSSALINRSDVCVPQAKATIWTYDGQQVSMDAEMVNFVNVQLLQFHGTIAPNTGIHAHASQIIGHDATTTVSKSSIDLDFGGAEIKGVSKISGATTTTQLMNSGLMKSQATGNTLGLTLASMGLGSITLGDNTLDAVTFKIGKIQDCGENLDNDNSSVLLVCVWEDYTIQQNGGTVVGIVMSADKCTYKILGKYATSSCSVLNAKDEGTNTAKTQMDKLFKELQFVSFSRTSNNYTQYNANGVNFYDNYELTLLDSLFVGGMTSFTSDGGVEDAGDAYVDTNSMYDFITVENWQAN